MVGLYCVEDCLFAVGGCIVLSLAVDFSWFYFSDFGLFDNWYIIQKIWTNGLILISIIALAVTKLSELFLTTNGYISHKIYEIHRLCRKIKAVENNTLFPREINGIIIVYLLNSIQKLRFNDRFKKTRLRRDLWDRYNLKWKKLQNIHHKYTGKWVLDT